MASNEYPRPTHDSSNGSIDVREATPKVAGSFDLHEKTPTQEDGPLSEKTSTDHVTGDVPGSIDVLHKPSANSSYLPSGSRKASGILYLPDGSPIEESDSSSEKHDIDHFSEAHGTLWRRWQGGQRMAKSEEEKIAGDPLTWRDLFRPPITRQWVHDGKLYKADERRHSTYIELFFDLAFVSSSHLLADAAVRPDPRAINIAVFVITFFIGFGQWMQLRRLINVHGSDDVLERLYILFRMILIIGYASCATGIEVEQVQEPDGTFRGWEIPPRFLDNVYWSARFILIAGLAHLGLHLQMAAVLRRFRWAIFYEAARLLPYLFLCLPLSFESIRSSNTVLVLSVTAIAAEWQIGWLIGFIAHHRAKHHLGWTGYRLAHNVEHLIDRSMAFVVLTLGEHVLQATYQAYETEVGFGREYGRAVCVVMISFVLLWIYCDSDGSRLYVHALRAWWMTSVAVQQVFYILIASLILASSPITTLIQNDVSAGGYHWFYAESIATYLLTVLATGLMHQNYDKAGSALINRYIRLSARAVCAAFVGCVPLIPGLTNLAFLSIVLGALVLEVIFEQVGKLGVVGDVERLKHEEDDPKHRGLPPKYRLSDLSEEEKGFLDAGIEDELGAIHAVTLRVSQRVAFTV